MIPHTSEPRLSGERFTAIYRIAGNEKEARAKALDLCLEQTVEFPGELVPAGRIRDEIVGRLESLESAGAGGFLAAVSYAIETAGGELTQFLNVIFGNSSIKPGIRLERLQLADEQSTYFKGPRFGRQGLRELLGIFDRPLLCTALKPMGLSAEDLAELAYRFALGGIDLIKDDHGLTNQPFAPFEQRVSLCVDAVRRANRQTGQRCLYVPNVTADTDEMEMRARLAKSAGARALLVSPGLAGLDAMRKLADNDEISLPILSHPAFQGSFVVSPESGISHFALFGQIARLAGADASIFPNFGGRFSFSREECSDLVEGTHVPMGTVRPIFPMPGGGMSLSSIPAMRQVYGKEVVLLVGGGLFRHGPNLVENCRALREMAAQFV